MNRLLGRASPGRDGGREHVPGKPRGPSMTTMSPFVAAVLGAAIALVFVGALWVVIRGLPERPKAPDAYDREAAAHVFRIIDALPAAALLVGPHDELVKYNEAAVTLGVSRGTRVGIPELLELVRQRRRSQESFSGPLDRAREPGTEAVDLTCRVIPFPDGTVLVIAEDESGLRRVDAVRRDFVANISHELKTPIGAIGILAEAVEAASDEPGEVIRFSQRLQRESARLAELVGQIIELSRLESADPRSSREVVDAVEVVDEAIARTREAAEARDVSLIKAYSLDGPAWVVGDRWQLSDAVANLVQNAITYSNHNARVAVTLLHVTVDGTEHIEIKVADNGIGIALEDQARLFERFYRVDYGRSRDSGGTGLGLSIVRHITLAHDGTIEVWSRPHQGSTFTMRLPAYLGPVNAEQEETEEQ